MVQLPLIYQEQLLKLVDNPAITSATLLGLLQDVLGGIPSAAILADKSSKGANFLKLLIENDRLDVLPEIATRFEALKDAAENTIDVTISSATGINDAQASEITQALTTRLGRAVNVTTSIDEVLIGCAVIRAGDFGIVVSVRAQLTNLSGVLSN